MQPNPKRDVLYAILRLLCSSCSSVFVPVFHTFKPHYAFQMFNIILCMLGPLTPPLTGSHFSARGALRQRRSRVGCVPRSLHAAPWRVRVRSRQRQGRRGGARGGEHQVCTARHILSHAKLALHEDEDCVPRSLNRSMSRQGVCARSFVAPPSKRAK